MPQPGPNTSRREFLAQFCDGLGRAALLSLLAREGFAEEVGPAAEFNAINPLLPKAPAFAPRAKRCIFIFLDGGLSQMDLFDPKPKLNELHGERLPDSMLKNVRFAFINH